MGKGVITGVFVTLVLGRWGGAQRTGRQLDVFPRAEEVGTPYVAFGPIRPCTISLVSIVDIGGQIRSLIAYLAEVLIVILIDYDSYTK